MKRIISLLLLLTTLVTTCIITGIPTGAAVVSKEGKLPFDDVDTGAWYAEGMIFCYVNGIVKGTSETTFTPNGELTRASFALMLANTVGADLSGYYNAPFADTPAGVWHSQAVAWAVDMGYMQGVSDAYFSPDAVITREQLATIFMRFMEEEHNVNYRTEVLDEYKDGAEISTWAREGMAYAIFAGLISGTSSTEKIASPKTNVTRSQAVRIFMVYMTDYHYRGCAHTYSDATCTKPRTCSQCGIKDGLANGHLCPVLNCETGSRCTVCDEYIYYDEYSHDYSEATCTEPATCSICGETKGKATGHKYGQYPCRGCTVCGANVNHTYAPATCTAPKTCTKCGLTEGKAAGHKIVAATCTQPSKCTVCGISSGLPAHKIVAADCTHPSRCTVCGLSAGAPLGHNYSAATCTKPATCSRCGGTTGTALGHSYGAATCTSGGTCSRCGATTGSGAGHSYAPATCTKPKTCTKCGATTGQANGHKIAAADCYNPSRCTVCGISSGLPSHKIANANCTQPSRCTICGITSGAPLGHTSTACGTKCTRCGYTNSSNHSYSNSVTYLKGATCTKCGFKANPVSWKQAYLNNWYIVEEMGSEEYGHYSLDDVNADGIPELFVQFGTFSFLFTPTDYSLETLALSRYPEYVPGSGYICASGGTGGQFWDKIYQIKNGKIILCASGETEGDYGNNHSWNGQRVSKSTYESYINYWINPAYSVYPWDLHQYSVYEIKSLLSS